ncbi:MAG: neutral zinc metallopeptidase [Fimbriimonadaceae bacterium]|nr:neutral zinc metallopeptidase [Alphaproteobacteria bacterium]
MRWRRGRRSSNVEDRRGRGSPFPGAGGKRGGFRFPTGRGTPVRRGGIGGIGLIIIVGLFLLFGGDLGSLLQQSPIGPGRHPRNRDPMTRRWNLSAPFWRIPRIPGTRYSSSSAGITASPSS